MTTRLGQGLALLLALGCAQGKEPATPMDSPPAGSSFELSTVERQVVEELNRVRSDPPGYALELAALRPYYHGYFLMIPGETVLQTREGVGALDEAIADLEQIAPASSLALHDGISRAARDHAVDIGGEGRLSHMGSDGSDLPQRLLRYGAFRGIASEAIAFGHEGPFRIVRELIIDDGVADRGHRRTLLDHHYRQVGVAVAPHALYGTVCVIDLATGFSTDRVTRLGP